MEQRFENQGYPRQSNPNHNTAPVPQTPTLIKVANEDEAWNFPPDYTGVLQYFYDGKNFYTKEFNANIPATIKTVFKKAIEPTESVPEVKADNSTPINTVPLERIIELENAIKELTEILKERFAISDELLREMLEKLNGLTIVGIEPVVEEKTERDAKGRFVKK